MNAGSNTMDQHTPTHKNVAMMPTETNNSLEIKNAHWQNGGQYTNELSWRSQKRSARHNMLQNDANASKIATGDCR